MLPLSLVFTGNKQCIDFEIFRREYNSVRPHSSLGYASPLSFVSSFESSNTRFQLVQSLGA
ncbi:MAG: transposase [Alphaproteobacteria bacterium]|nr:transposase [Alphaproteobacteria bacterium]